jgi:hypothetical protein
VVVDDLQVAQFLHLIMTNLRIRGVIDTLATSVVLVLEKGHRPYAMFSDYWKYDWVLDIVEYRSTKGLLAALDRRVIQPATEAVETLGARRAQAGRFSPGSGSP